MQRSGKPSDNLVRRRFPTRLGQRALAEALEPRRLLAGPDFADRGWVSIIVDETVAGNLSEKLTRLKQDLIGDGWRVTPIHTDAPRMDDEEYVWKNVEPRGPRTVGTGGTFNSAKLAQYKNELQAVKNMIAADVEYADSFGGELKQVIIVGHVTVPYSGGSYGHGNRAKPTDLYYADLNATPGTWGDDHWDITAGGDTQHERTTNQDGDSRFDTDTVPRGRLIYLMR